MVRTRQFALPFPYRPAYAGAAFMAAPSNAAALAWLDRAADWPGGRLVVWGEAGCGKTHLLHRWAEHVGAAWTQGEALRGLPAVPRGPVAIDDADVAAEEAALLHLLNAASEAGHPVLLAGRAPPSRWRLRLPDLASRLRAVAAVAITAPEDSLLRALLASLLADRGLAVPAALQDWLLPRLPRRAAVMREAAALLDRAAWEAGRQVTRAMAAHCLAKLLADSEPDGCASWHPEHELCESAPAGAADAARLL